MYIEEFKRYFKKNSGDLLGPDGFINEEAKNIYDYISGVIQLYGGEIEKPSYSFMDAEVQGFEDRATNDQFTVPENIHLFANQQTTPST